MYPRRGAQAETCGSREGVPSNARGGRKGESKVLERLETGVVLLKSAWEPSCHPLPTGVQARVQTRGSWRRAFAGWGSCPGHGSLRRN